MLNLLRALRQVYSFEIRMFVYGAYRDGMLFYIIENTTRKQRVKMYREAWDKIGYVRGRVLLDYFKENYDVKINIYQLKNCKWLFIQEYSGIE